MRNCKSVVSALALCSFLPLASYAQIEPALQPETPSEDTSPVAPVNPPAVPGSRTLNGGVERSRYLGEPAGGQAGQALEGQSDNSALRAQAENKIARRIPLNAAEFRSLDAGIIGFIAVKPDLARSAMVVKLLPGCPAEQAGIKIGDVILRQTVDPSTVKTLRKPSWLFSCGQADEPCEITIMRQGHVFNVRLAYMNIEDVTDERLRHRLESLVEQAGFKAYHSPERADMSELLESLDDQ